MEHAALTQWGYFLVDKGAISKQGTWAINLTVSSVINKDEEKYWFQDQSLWLTWGNC